MTEVDREELRAIVREELAATHYKEMLDELMLICVEIRARQELADERRDCWPRWMAALRPK